MARSETILAESQGAWRVALICLIHTRIHAHIASEAVRMSLWRRVAEQFPCCDARYR